jgi:hypothetical protein
MHFHPGIGNGDDPSPPPPSDDQYGSGNGNEEQRTDGHDAMETYGKNTATGATSSNNFKVYGQSAPNTSHSTRRGGAGEGVSGSVVYDLLMKNGCIGEDGKFVWNNGDVEDGFETVEEMDGFLIEDRDQLSFQQKIDQVADISVGEAMDLVLLAEILPNFEKINMKGNENLEVFGETRRWARKARNGVMFKPPKKSLGWIDL